MIVKILGVLDIIVGMIFWIYGIFNLEFLSGFIMILGLFLLVKGLIFATGFAVASVLDILAAIVIIISVGIILPKLIVIIVALFLLQKGVVSMIS